MQILNPDHATIDTVTSLRNFKPLPTKLGFSIVRVPWVALEGYFSWETPF
jgi:hypothetical protein